MRQFVVWYRQAGAELDWENFVGINPNRFSTIGNFTITVVCIGSSIAILLLTSSPAGFFGSRPNVAWLIAVVALFGAVAYIELRYLPKRKWKPLPDRGSQERAAGAS
jgi:hypothetical protein